MLQAGLKRKNSLATETSTKACLVEPQTQGEPWGGMLGARTQDLRCLGSAEGTHRALVSLCSLLALQTRGELLVCAVGHLFHQF